MDNVFWFNRCMRNKHENTIYMDYVFGNVGCEEKYLIYVHNGTTIRKRKGIIFEQIYTRLTFTITIILLNTFPRTLSIFYLIWHYTLRGNKIVFEQCILIKLSAKQCLRT